MAQIVVQDIVLAGIIDPTMDAAAAAGDTFLNDGHTVLKIVNSGLAARTVTIARQSVCRWGSIHSEVYTVAGGETLYAGSFPINRFNNASNLVTITYSSEADLTLAALRLT